MTASEIVAKRRGAATWLAEQGFAIVHIPQGRKKPSGGDGWQHRAVTDPGMAGAMIRSERDQFGALPKKGSGLLIIDQDVPDKLEELGVEIPATLRVRTSVKVSETGWRGQHVYLRLAAGIDEREVPSTWDGGEVRHAGSGQVVGPWSLHPSGVTYEPLNGVRAIGIATRELVDALLASRARMKGRRDKATGPEDPGWYIEHGRHEHLVDKGRKMRGDGVTGDRLLDELLRLDRDRHRPSIADLPERGVAEIEAIVAWLMKEIADDPPPFSVVADSSDSSATSTFPEPENRGRAVLSPLGGVEYVEDLLRPGRIVVVAAEEGTGKSYAIDDELAIRLAVAGGSFAGTWPILQTGPVLVLSEMHPDDDFEREETVLSSLGRTRADLDGRYFRLSLFTAANGAPALMDDAWRGYIIDWVREHGVLVAIFDTGTAATNVDPWGRDMQQVFRNAKQMLEAVPGLVLVFVVHLKKPSTSGAGRGLSAVLGEWGRWNDVTVMLENDGVSLERVKVTVRKRVRRERRFVATKRDGLLVDPQELEGIGPKVPAATVLAAIHDEPGLSIQRLAATLGVSRSTARKYADEVPGIVLIPGLRGALTCHLSEGVSEAGDMSPPGGGVRDVSPVTPLDKKGVTDTSLTTPPLDGSELLAEIVRVTGGELLPEATA
jgi:hypothetical protein